MKPVTRYSLYGLSALLVLLAVIAYMYVSKGSMDNPVKLSKEVTMKIKGTTAALGNASKKKLMYADFYNGSDWVITSVDVQVGSLNKEMSEEYPSSAPWFDKRTFRLKIPQNDSDDSDEMKTNGILMPLSSARFEAYIGDFIEDTGKGGWEWGIEAVHGFKP